MINNYQSVLNNPVKEDLKKISVLFMQSQNYFGADSFIHAQLMQYYNRERVTVYAACAPNVPANPSPAFVALRKIPGLNIRPTNFGPTVHNLSKLERLKNSLNTIPSLFSLTGLARYIKKNHIEIIHCTEKPRDAFYGAILAKLTGAKLVIHLHVKCENWLSPLVRWAMHQADGILAISDFVRESLLAMNYSDEKIHVVLNSLDVTTWDYRLSGAAIREEYGIEPNTPLLVAVSRLFYWKGHTELLKALSKVKQNNINFKLLIVGEDDSRATPGRGSYSTELKILAEELCLTEHIIFTGFRKDVAEIMAAADIYAMPSFEEPFGMVYLEAMAMKRPVIALDNGGSREVIEQGKTGLLSLPQDIDQLASNIITLIKNPELRKQMGEAGRVRVEQYFNPQLMAENTEKVYRQILTQ